MAIADLKHAELIILGDNEIGFRQKEDPLNPGRPSLDDVIKLRIQAFVPEGRNKFYIGAISMDVLTRDEHGIHTTEVGFLEFAVDEFVDGDKDPVPIISAFLTSTIHGSEDKDEKRIFTAAQKGVRVFVPFYANDTPPPIAALPIAAEPPIRLRAPGGQTELHCQGDGNAVMYDVRPGITPPVGDPGPWVALSTLKDGKLRDFREDGDYR